MDVYKIHQIVDNGNAVQISLIEDVQTEPLSQKQLIVENVAKKFNISSYIVKPLPICFFQQTSLHCSTCFILRNK